MSTQHYGYLRDIRLVVTEYIGTFFYKDKSGRWRCFNRIGNAEVAMQMLRMFEQVGHKTEIVDKSTESDTLWMLKGDNAPS